MKKFKIISKIVATILTLGFIILICLHFNQAEQKYMDITAYSLIITLVVYMILIIKTKKA